MIWHMYSRIVHVAHHIFSPKAWNMWYYFWMCMDFGFSLYLFYQTKVACVDCGWACQLSVYLSFWFSLAMRWWDVVTSRIRGNPVIQMSKTIKPVMAMLAALSVQRSTIVVAATDGRRYAHAARSVVMTIWMARHLGHSSWATKVKRSLTQMPARSSQQRSVIYPEQEYQNPAHNQLVNKIKLALGHHSPVRSSQIVI